MRRPINANKKRLSLIDGAASMTGELLLLDSGRHLGKGVCWGWHGPLRPMARVGGLRGQVGPGNRCPAANCDDGRPLPNHDALPDPHRLIPGLLLLEARQSRGSQVRRSLGEVPPWRRPHQTHAPGAGAASPARLIGSGSRGSRLGGVAQGVRLDGYWGRSFVIVLTLEDIPTTLSFLQPSQERLRHEKDFPIWE